MAARMAMVMGNLPEGCSLLAGGLGGRMTNRQTVHDESVHCAPGIFSVPSRPRVGPRRHPRPGRSAPAGEFAPVGRIGLPRGGRLLRLGVGHRAVDFGRGQGARRDGVMVMSAFISTRLKQAERRAGRTQWRR
jgi:hypothetical protein